MLVDTTAKTVPELPALPTEVENKSDQPKPKPRSHQPRNGRAPPKERDRPPPATPAIPPVIDGAIWTPSDRPLFALRPRWHLATDDELQWIVYRLAGGQWRAVSFPTTRKSLLIVLRERVSERYGTLDGLDASAVEAVNALPDHFRDWLGPAATARD
jgi:hypothetical protein